MDVNVKNLVKAISSDELQNEENPSDAKPASPYVYFKVLEEGGKAKIGSIILKPLDKSRAVTLQCQGAKGQNLKTHLYIRFISIVKFSVRLVYKSLAQCNKLLC